MSVGATGVSMDWKRERDGLAVVGGVVLVIGILVAGASVVQFVSTLLAAFLGGLLALRVGTPTDVEDEGPTPAATSDAVPSGGVDDGPDAGPPSNAADRDPKDGDAPVGGADGEESTDESGTESADEPADEPAGDSSGRA